MGLKTKEMNKKAIFTLAVFLFVGYTYAGQGSGHLISDDSIGGVDRCICFTCNYVFL
jgi:hypothetical protein